MTDTFDPTTDKNVHLTGLFFCHPCHTIDEIPNYNPDTAHNDPRIDHIYSKHVRRHPSTEDRFILEWAALAFAPTRHWKDPEYNKQIKEKLLEGMGQGGFDQDFYDTQNTFKADAMECWKRHGNPAYKSNTQPKCTDYLDFKMEIKPNTNAERKKAGLPSYDETKATRSFICEYCPYHQSVMVEERKI